MSKFFIETKFERLLVRFLNGIQIFSCSFSKRKIMSGNYVEGKLCRGIEGVPTLSAGIDSPLFLHFKPTTWALNFPRKLTNRIISNQERRIRQFCWNWARLPLQNSSLQPPKFDVDKQTPEQRKYVIYFVF